MTGPSLVFVAADNLSIRRLRTAGGFRYVDDDGSAIGQAEEVDRLNRIGLPPAYGEARYCPDPRGHLQAFGIDARGRRQYRYHPDFRASKENEKFALCRDFGSALPALRKHLEIDLTRPPADRECVLASLVRILDAAFLRIGNETYARDNKSFGLTTLRNRHARVKRGTVHLEFRGKGGIMRAVRLDDRSLARIVRHCQDLPGQHLFQYRGEDGAIHPVTSNDVNSYLREAMGGDFTAKHFRTWHASVLAYTALREGLTLKDMLARVSAALGNTPAVARKSYVHPRLMEIALAGGVTLPRPPAETRRQSRAERGLIALLGGAG